MGNRTFSRVACAVMLVAFASSAGADPIIYPAKGQSADQQTKDQNECQGWAKQNTGIDPVALANTASQSAAQQPVGGERMRGAARGAAGGAVVGAIAGDAGKGAAAGAAAGTMVGGSRQRQKQRANTANQNAQNADVQSKLATYNKAYAACLEGKGYTVK